MSRERFAAQLWITSDYSVLLAGSNILQAGYALVTGRLQPVTVTGRLHLVIAGFRPVISVYRGATDHVGHTQGGGRRNVGHLPAFLLIIQECAVL